MSDDNRLPLTCYQSSELLLQATSSSGSEKPHLPTKVLFKPSAVQAFHNSTSQPESSLPSPLSSPSPLHPASPGILLCALSTNTTVTVQLWKRSKALLNQAGAGLSSPSAAQHISSITQKCSWPTPSFYFTSTTSQVDDFSLGISNKMLVLFPSF